VKQAHAWTDEDRAYAAAQWASGVKQREIAAVFGYKGPAMVCVQIRNFMKKYSGLPVKWTDLSGDEFIAQGVERKAAVKQAIARFVAPR
jgi:hypothetical protein